MATLPCGPGPLPPSRLDAAFGKLAGGGLFGVHGNDQLEVVAVGVVEEHGHTGPAEVGEGDLDAISAQLRRPRVEVLKGNGVGVVIVAG